MDLPRKLDRLVHRSRLDFMTPYGAPRPRNLRWLPALVLLALPAGYALLFAGIHGLYRHQDMTSAAWLVGAGMLLFWGAVVASCLIGFFGPRVAPEAEGLDERELMLRARAGNVSGHLLVALVTLACFYGAYAAVFGTWMPATAYEWFSLGFAVLAYARLMPALIASWLQPPPDAEE